MSKITYADKIGITPKTVHINQVWDDDMNEIKSVVNNLDDAVTALATGTGNLVNVSAIWQSGFTFDCTAQSFPIDNTFYSAPNTTIVLNDSDATLDRIDLIVAKAPISPATVGTIQVIQGTLAASGVVVPPEYNPSTYYVIKQVIVKAASSIPSDSSGNDLSKEVVYSDGSGEPTEWTFSSNSARIVNSGGVINATNTIEGDYSTMTNNTDITGLSTSSDFALTFGINLKASAGTSYIFVKLYNEIGGILGELSFNSGNYGFVGSSTGMMQLIALNSTDFNFINVGNIRKVSIYLYKSFTGYELNNIQFNLGSYSNTSTTIQPNSVGLTELKDEVKDLLYMQRVEMGTGNIIDWTNPNFTFLRNDLTANITITDSNLPQDFNTKEITLKVNIKTYAIDFPIYYNHMGGDWEEDVINTILIQCENGNSGSEVVNYWVNPKTV